MVFITGFLELLLLQCSISLSKASIENELVKAAAAADEGLDKKPTGQIWAVLIAGSNGFWNYRHQADVCHAWHLLVDHGVKPENIITMMYDDVANNTENPYPGKLFNHPQGNDVYQGVRIDYRGDDVNLANIIGVLLGNETATGGKKVLKSTTNDKVFVYYSDHGGTGVIGLPTWPYMTVEDLSETLKQMHRRELYKELTFYLEACESGSMFDWPMAKKLNIYAVTAANGQESSWACYCGTDLLPGACLGDHFSVNWMEDSDKQNLRRETLASQFKAVQNRTDDSHVLSFGELRIQHQFVSEFQGKKRARHPQQQMLIGKSVPAGAEEAVERPAHQFTPADFLKVPSRDVPLFIMAKKQQQLSGGGRGNAIGQEIMQFHEKRQYLVKQMANLVDNVLPLLLQSPPSAAATLRSNLLNTRPGRVSDMKCHRQLVHAFHQHCFDLNKNPYALEHIFVLANLCELQIPAAQIVEQMAQHCVHLTITEGIL